MRRFDVEKLNTSGGGCRVADQYLGTSWPEDGAVEEKWRAVSAALTSAADGVHRQIINLIGSGRLSLDYSHCLTTGIGLTIGGCRQVRQKILFFFEEPDTMGS